MSFLLVAGLSVECPACGSTRWIPRKGGPAYLQVGDQNVLIQSEIQNRSGRARQGHFYIEAWCSNCAAPVLASKHQALANERDRLLAEITIWAQSLRQKCHVRILEHIAQDTGRHWLQKTYPALYRECFEDPRCGLYPDFFVKMKKRFRTQASRTPEREGSLLPDGFDQWLTMEASSHPFADELNALQCRIDSLAQDTHGLLPFLKRKRWRIAEVVNPWQGINLNPYLQYESTVFVAEGEPGSPLYFIFEVNPHEIASPCESALQRPLVDSGEYTSFKDIAVLLNEKVNTIVDSLVWPLS